MSSTTRQENMPQELILGRYELIERIGSGGFSTVYRARDHKMGRQVALKAIPRTEELSDRAAREAHAAAKLGHPHIVTVFELAEDGRNIYLVSELVEGMTLAQHIAEEPLSDREYVKAGLQVLNALDHAHNRGVVHRDIKPDNVMLTFDREPQVKLMDLGIAQLEDTQRITRQGDILGTVAYMSPEQADGRPVDSATDVYSAALTLYECLTGENPFAAATAAETVARIQAGAPPLVHLRRDLPWQLSDVLEEAMEPDPGLRIGVRRVAAGLEQILPLLPEDDTGATRILHRQEPDGETSVLRRANQPRLGLYEELWQRFGFIAVRAANAGLAAAVAWAALYHASYYPANWRLPLLLMAALAVGLLPRVGLLFLAALALLPVADYSGALGAMLTAVIGIYFLVFGLLWPEVALLPALACVLGWPGLGLAYPAICGAAGRLRTGIVLGLLGGVAFTVMQLFFNSSIDYLGLANGYGLTAHLAGQYNPVEALRSLAEPLRAQPAIALQPAIWMAAAVPAALLVRRRSLFQDLAGLVLSDAVLVAGYMALPAVFAGFALPGAFFMKTLVLCVIIQVVLLLLSPRKTRSKPQTLSLLERTEET